MLGTRLKVEGRRQETYVTDAYFVPYLDTLPDHGAVYQTINVITIVVHN